MSQLVSGSSAPRIASDPPQEEPAEKMFAAATSAAAARPKSERLRLAIENFYARSTRRGHPEGGWQDGLWYPSAGERQVCCEGIRPTIMNRQALEGHCRTQAHVATLYGVPVGELKAAVRVDRKQGSPIAQRVASTFLGPALPAAETFAELRQKARDGAFAILHTALAEGLPLFERLHASRGCAPTGDGHEMTLLLESAAESTERLRAAIHSARSQEALMALASSLLAALKTALEPVKVKGRRARAGRTPHAVPPHEAIQNNPNFAKRWLEPLAPDDPASPADQPPGKDGTS